MTTEDLKREPGASHAVIGFTALFCVLFAMLLGAILLTGTTSGPVCAVILALVAVPVVATGLQHKARRDRDRERRKHPST